MDDKVSLVLLLAFETGVRLRTYGNKTLVVLLCMHRCGSSLTARLLQRLGMSLGPFELLEAHESNKYGHFEAKPFLAINRELQSSEFGFVEDVPDDAESFRRFCERDGRWRSEATVTADAVARGRDLVERLVASGRVSGFKEPRTVLTWPVWRRVFETLPQLRIVPLFLIRTPHEVAMSIFCRLHGHHDYARCLEVAGIHFRRMKHIHDAWAGPKAVVQFDPRVYGDQIRRAATLCGLPWSDSVLAEVYDASCRHHDPMPVDHPAQTAYEALAGLPHGAIDVQSLRGLLADAVTRETILRRGWKEVCRDRDALHREGDDVRRDLATARQEVALLHQERDDLARRLAASECELARIAHNLDLIRNSRTWRLRQALLEALKLKR